MLRQPVQQQAGDVAHDRCALVPEGIRRGGTDDVLQGLALIGPQCLDLGQLFFQAEIHRLDTQLAHLGGDRPVGGDIFGIARVIRDHHRKPARSRVKCLRRTRQAQQAGAQVPGSIGHRHHHGDVVARIIAGCGDVAFHFGKQRVVVGNPRGIERGVPHRAFQHGNQPVVEWQQGGKLIGLCQLRADQGSGFFIRVQIKATLQ